MMGTAFAIQELMKKWPNGFFGAKEEIKLPAAEEIDHAKSHAAAQRAAAIADTLEIEARLGSDEPSMKR